MPEPRISIQPVPLHAGHPMPPQTPHCTSISADGSVNGKNDGRKRVRDAPKKRSANRFSVALRSTKLMPSSTRGLRSARTPARATRRRNRGGRRCRESSTRIGGAIALQRAHLHRRRVRAQQRAALEIERVVRVQRRMVGREVERAEVVPLRSPPPGPRATVKPSSRKISSISSMTSVTGCFAPRHCASRRAVVRSLADAVGRRARRASSQRSASAASSRESRLVESLARRPACPPWRCVRSASCSALTRAVPVAEEGDARRLERVGVGRRARSAATPSRSTDRRLRSNNSEDPCSSRWACRGYVNGGRTTHASRCRRVLCERDLTLRSARRAPCRRAR